MNEMTKALARNMFRLRVLEASGQAYQDLFVRVMQYAHPRFHPVRPYGKLGDRGNDGFIRPKGVFYQVYSPDDCRRRPNDALQKLRADFKTLKSYWKSFASLRAYFFVINDKYKGAPANLEVETERLRKRHRLKDCELLLASDLERTLFGLPDEVIISIIGHIPVLAPDEFLLLNGLAYFLSAWIDFERTARRLVEEPSGITRPIVGRRLIEALTARLLISREDGDALVAISHWRNRVVHGDTAQPPGKEHIDRIVSITRTLRSQGPP